MTQNLAKRGTTADNWANGTNGVDISTADFSDDDYVLIHLGTNDGGGNVTPADYLADMQVILNKIITDGAVPIVGEFPFWWAAAQTGFTSAPSKAFAGAVERLRSVIRRYCAEQGIRVAKVRDHLGATIRWSADNVHLTEMGEAAIARAFAQVMAGDKMQPTPTRNEWGPWRTIPSSWFFNSWVAGGRTPRYRVHRDGRVQLQGAIQSGTVGNAAIQFPAWLRPSLLVAQPISSRSGSTATIGQVELSGSNGNFVPYSVNNASVSLDQITWTRG